MLAIRHWNSIKYLLRYLHETSDTNYFILIFKTNICFVMLMHDIFQIFIKLDHNQDVSLLGDLLSKLWWTPPLIIKNYLRCMRQAENAYG